MKKAVIFFFTLGVSVIRAALEQDETEFKPNIPYQSNNDSSSFFGDFKNISKNYFYEIIGVYAILFFISNYHTGKQKNIVMLNEWRDSCRQVFANNFAHVGVGNQGDTREFIQQSNCSYKFYASGRVNIPWCLATFELKKRQDLISMWVFDFIWPEKDRIIIDIPIKAVPLPICMGLMKKKEGKNAQENLFDIKYLTRKSGSLNGLSEKLLSLYTENQEVSDTILDDYVVKQINNNIKLFHTMHITDQKVFSTSNLHLRLVLNFPAQNKDMAQLNGLIQMGFYIADKLVLIQLSSKVRAASQAERLKLEDIKNKEKKEKLQEELQKKKEEQRKKELEAISKLPPEKQRKIEEREKQNELKRRMKIVKF